MGLEKCFSHLTSTQWSMFMIHSGPVGGKNQKLASTVVRWAETAQNGHSVDFFFVSAQSRDFFFSHHTLLPEGGPTAKW
jgi:hypothetical protein